MARNKLSGSATFWLLLIAVILLAMIPINSAGNVPDWLFGVWLILILLLCVATLFFLFQRIFSATRRSDH